MTMERFLELVAARIAEKCAVEGVALAGVKVESASVKLTFVPAAVLAVDASAIKQMQDEQAAYDAIDSLIIDAQQTLP